MRFIFLLLIIIIGASSSFIACGGGSQGDGRLADDPDQESAAIMLQVDWPNEPVSSLNSQTEAVRAAIDCSAMNVDRISAQVFSDAHDLLQTGGPWDCTDSGGTISNVPARDDLLVRLCAFDIDGQEVYRGEAPNVNVQASQTVNVSISMKNVFNRAVSMVQDLNPGTGSSFPHRLSELQDQLCFIALDINSGFELFIAGADGSGAQLLRDIYPNDGLDRIGVMAPTDFVELNGWLYFRANDGSGYHLWRTNGTSASTELVPGCTALFNPTEMTVCAGMLFFAADGDGSGRELWFFNDSSEQVNQVADIYPGEAGSNPHELTVSGEYLFFVAENGQNGYEVWKTNADGGDCAMAADIYEGATGSYPVDLTDANGRLFFIAKGDGTTGSRLWMLFPNPDDLDFIVETVGSQYSSLRNLTWINGTTLAFSGSLSGTGQELYLYDWQTDTTPRRITNLNPADASSYPANFVYLGDTLYFTASISNNIEHLWAYSIDQQNLTRLTPDMQSPHPRDLTAVNQNLYFSASDGSVGRSLWVTDGTRTGIVVATQSGKTQLSPSNLIAASNGRLYYSAFDTDHGEELFYLDDQ